MALCEVYNVTVRSERDSALSPEQLTLLRQCFQRSADDPRLSNAMVMPVYQSREGLYSAAAQRLVGFQVASTNQHAARIGADYLTFKIFKDNPCLREEKSVPLQDDLFTPSQADLDL